ncbi:MAG: nucleotide sugar dehydrogenase [Bryobacteraceae bacterium]
MQDKFAASSATTSPVSILVVGLGYVGCVTAACLASLGHHVTGVDPDESKVSRILAGRAPFYEPGLEELLAAAVNSGHLCATTSMASINATVVFICVGTPSDSNGDLDLSHLRRAIEELSASLASDSPPVIVAVRSTVFPGTCEEVVIPMFQNLPQVKILSHPEFLREGSAISDFLEPPLLVFGGIDAMAGAQVAALYVKLPASPCFVSFRTAEMIKYACNAFHGLKVSFSNEVASLAARVGADGEAVMNTLCKDRTLNISPAYLKPGFAFGGSCLPKDLRAIAYRSSLLGIDLPLLSNILPSNELHLERCVERVLRLPRRLGILGISFKENTDDVRGSPGISLLSALIKNGRELKVYDPRIVLKLIYGTNLDHLLTMIPDIDRLLTSDYTEVLEWADCLVVTHQIPSDLAEAVTASGKPVTDLSRAFEDYE